MLWQKLAALRQRSGLSVSEVCERLGVAKPTAYQWEKPYNGGPGIEHLQALLDLYQATDDERLEAWRLRALPRPVEESAA